MTILVNQSYITLVCCFYNFFSGIYITRFKKSLSNKISFSLAHIFLKLRFSPDACWISRYPILFSIQNLRTPHSYLIDNLTHQF